MRLELHGITKRFPGGRAAKPPGSGGTHAGVIANDHIDLTIEPGEVHGLLGENGAGKTTLMNILYGLYRADEGELLIDGQPTQTPGGFASPADAIAAGIGMVHQHFMLVPVFTVAENVTLGAEPGVAPLGWLDRAEARRRVAALGTRFGLAVDPDAVVEDLPVGTQQRAEILKALARDARVLILDEPTAVLTPPETEELFAAIDALRTEGTSVVFISHKLREVRAISDRITVLRRGQVVGTVTPDASEQELATMMVGRPVELVVQRTPAVPGEPVAVVDRLTVHDERGHLAVDGVSFTVRAREIVAIAGVEGNGQHELARALTGLAPVTDGTFAVRGVGLVGRGRRAALRAGVSFIPEDRAHDGLVGEFSVAENLVLDRYREEPFGGGIGMNRREVEAHAHALVDDFDIRTPSSDTAVGTLSGGNQQKVLVARALAVGGGFLVAAQPTRGIDVGSIEYVHRRLVERRDEGAAVLVISSELDEVLALGDRVAVMFRGRLYGPFEPPIDRDHIGLLMAGTAPEEDPTRADDGEAPA